MSSVLDEALKLIALGIPVIPLRAKRKLPIIDNYYENCFRTEEPARSYFTKFNDDKGLGIVIAPDTKHVGIDLDCNHGATEEHLKQFPRTWTVKTRNGFHLYFKRPSGGCKGGPVIKIDDGRAWNQQPAVLYVTNRQFVAPPTVVSIAMVEGKETELDPFEYRWHSDLGGELSPWDCPLAELPDFCVLKDDAAKASATKQVVQANEGKYPPNFRHHMLLRTAVKMRSAGATPEQISERLHARNVQDCNPPKPPGEVNAEIANLVKFVMEKTVVREQKFVGGDAGEFQEYVVPLGFRDDDYFYTSSSNRQIVRISAGAHTQAKLCSLMPLEYWLSVGYRNERSGALNLGQLQSDLMSECRAIGIFDEKKTRGIGCWLDEGRLVVHLGEKLLVDGKEHDINQIDSKYIYALGPSIDEPSMKPLELSERKALIDLCQGLDWVQPGSGTLLAGAMAVFRVCGALPWRPHLWITSPKGSGKTTLMEHLVNKVAGIGKWGIAAQGDSTEAGIRQEIRHQSVPITYDEAETENDSSNKKVQRVVQLARQASAVSQGRILKGTVDGRGMNFSISSSFCLASINPNLQNEADKSRFCVLELKRGDKDRWATVRKLYDPITEDFCDRLFARALSLFPVLMKNREICEDAVAEKTDRRTGQQFGILLAGYALIHQDQPISMEAARRLVETISHLSTGDHQAEEGQQDERECLQTLLDSTIEIESPLGRRRIAIIEAVREAQVDDGRILELQRIGVDVTKEHLLVRNNTPALKTIYRDTKWAAGWQSALSRLQGAKKRHSGRFLGATQKCVRLPIDLVL